MNIYEVNISSWKHKPEEKFPSYIGFAEEIIPYLKRCPTPTLNLCR